MRWRKSSFSTNNGACLEVAWTKSSFSNGNNGDCVEVAWHRSFASSNNGTCGEVTSLSNRVAARDSKNTDGPILTFNRPAWATFLSTIAH